MCRDLKLKTSYFSLKGDTPPNKLIYLVFHIGVWWSLMCSNQQWVKIPQSQAFSLIVQTNAERQRTTTLYTSSPSKMHSIVQENLRICQEPTPALGNPHQKSTRDWLAWETATTVARSLSNYIKIVINTFTVISKGTVIVSSWTDQWTLLLSSDSFWMKNRFPLSSFDSWKSSTLAATATRVILFALCFLSFFSPW